jgi:hypothetical protein
MAMGRRRRRIKKDKGRLKEGKDPGKLERHRVP